MTNLTGLPKGSAVLPASDAPLTKYRAHVAHLDMTEKAKDELLNAVWRIMRSFVDRAFGDDPAQIARGAASSSEGKDAPVDASVVSSSRPGRPEDSIRLTDAFLPIAAAGRRKEET